MKLIVLGSGTSIPHPQRSSAGLWLQTNAGSIMLDFGPNALFRVAQEGLDWQKIDAIWVSHFHRDHCCGLPSYLFGARSVPPARDGKWPLRILGGGGTRRLVEEFDLVNKYRPSTQPFSFDIVEVEPEQRFNILPGVSATAHKTRHTDESLAIRIEDRSGKNIVYTSDTGFAKDLSAFSEGCDLLIMESSYLKDKKVPQHLELAEAMYLIARAKPKRAMLTHFYAEWDEVDFNTEVGRFDPACEVIEARDGLRLDIGE